MFKDIDKTLYLHFLQTYEPVSVLLYSLGCTLCILSIYAMSTNAFKISFSYMVEINISICSFSVRKLGQKSKRTQIFNFLKAKKVQICFLQETHSTTEIEKNLGSG